MVRAWLLVGVFVWGCVPGATRPVEEPARDADRGAASTGPSAGETDAVLESRARELLDRAREIEPEVTATLIRLAGEAGGEMLGLEHRFKTLESSLRKLRLMLTEDPSLTAEEVTIQDALRYTMRVDDEPAGNYVRTVAGTLDALEAQGHAVLVVKNYWPDGDNYSGVNTVLEAPSGLPWELQFHTTDSYRVQHETRVAYEELRLVSTPPERKRALFDEMTRTWDTVPIPTGVLLPQNLHEREEIRDRARP
jgi:hypothetical protein